jgi:hypothetical protein
MRLTPKKSARIALLGELTLLTSLLSIGYAAPANAAGLPGGKANWVASVGGLTDGTSYQNWVRLGYYQFATDGTVAHNWWHWAQREQSPRVGTGADFECSTNTDVPPECEVLTGQGFTGSPEGGFTGTYSMSGSGLTVSWTHDRNGNRLSKTLVENWTIGAVDAELQRASGGPSGFSNYSATHGFAYGSNASFDYTSRASMAELQRDGAQDGGVNYNSWQWNRNKVENVTSGFSSLSIWSLCDSGQCLGYRAHNTHCDCGAEAPSRDGQYYLAEHDGGRRNSIWLWCGCLADGRGETCYTGNSHIRPLLQVIDDGGDFRGWVGVEPFSNASSPGDFFNEYWIAFEFTDSV